MMSLYILWENWIGFEIKIGFLDRIKCFFLNIICKYNKFVLVLVFWLINFWMFFFVMFIDKFILFYDEKLKDVYRIIIFDL